MIVAPSRMQLQHVTRQQDPSAISMTTATPAYLHGMRSPWFAMRFHDSRPATVLLKTRELDHMQLLETQVCCLDMTGGMSDRAMCQYAWKLKFGTTVRNWCEEAVQHVQQAYDDISYVIGSHTYSVCAGSAGMRRPEARVAETNCGNTPNSNPR